MLQLDEEVEGMQAKVLALEKELRELKGSTEDGGASNGTALPKEKTSKSTHNGPIETVKDKLGSRSQDS